MKKLGLVLLAVVAFAACSSSSSNNNNKPNNACTSAENNHSKCVGTLWETCNGSSWVTTKDCAATNQDCVASTTIANTVSCQTPITYKSEFEACTGSGTGNCTSPLTCEAIGTSPTKFCATTCTGSDCGTDRYCETGISVASSNFCWPTATENGMCWSAAGCTNANPVCESPSTFSDSQECLSSCSPANIGTTTGCTGGETCLYGSFWVCQGSADCSSPTTCTGTVGTQSTCDAGYLCETFSKQGGGTENDCARLEGVCGTKANLFLGNTHAAESTFLDGLQSNLANACELDGSGLFCAPTGTSAVVDCSLVQTFDGFDTFFLAQDGAGNHVTCTGVSNELTCVIAGGTCVDFGPGTGKVCASIAQVCAAFCEDEDGVAISGACTGVGGGNCVEPTDIYVGRPVIEGGASNPTTCTTAGTQDVCSTGFTCSDYFSTQSAPTNYCIRPRKICN